MNIHFSFFISFPAFEGSIPCSPLACSKLEVLKIRSQLAPCLMTSLACSAEEIHSSSATLAGASVRHWPLLTSRLNLLRKCIRKCATKLWWVLFMSRSFKLPTCILSDSSCCGFYHVTQHLCIDVFVKKMACPTPAAPWA